VQPQGERMEPPRAAASAGDGAHLGRLPCASALTNGWCSAAITDECTCSSRHRRPAQPEELLGVPADAMLWKGLVSLKLRLNSDVSIVGMVATVQYVFGEHAGRLPQAHNSKVASAARASGA
jgi:hypothetical protein